jgi:hypothetical protein
MEKGLKIISLTAENIKKLVAVHIVPTGNMVQLTGKNGQGKTSVMDCISWAFEGKAKIQQCPIRFGENNAWIEIDLGPYVVKRTFKTRKDGEWDTTITVTSKDGSEFKQPQTLLDTVFGDLAFDPLKFSRASRDEQVEMVEGLVKDFDFKKSRAEEALVYEERTVVNRKAKESSLTHMSFKDVPVPEPEKVDVKDLTQQLAEAGQANIAKERIVQEKDRAIDAATKEIQEAENNIITSENAIQEARKAIVDLEDVINRQRVRKTQAEGAKRLAQSIEPPKSVDINGLKTNLDSAQAKNAIHETWTKKNEAKQLVEKYEAESKGLTTVIEGIQQKRRDAVANAGIPVVGISFSEEGVLLGTTPFEQASDAEKLRTSIAIAMAANPTLRVIRVRDGSLLDEEGMQLLAKMADEKDCQVWVERVGSGTVGFELVDGSVKS